MPIRTTPLRQVGVVVRDADAAMRYWSSVIGAGPFCVFRHLTFENFRYAGQSSQSPDLTLAIGHSGPFQVEILQQHNDVPSVYRDFLDAGHEGVQHLCSWYSDSPSYEAARQDLIDGGLVLMQEGLAVGVEVRFAYFTQRGAPAWPQFEISEGLKPSMMPIIDRLEALNRHWDRTNPILEGFEALLTGPTASP